MTAQACLAAVVFTSLAVALVGGFPRGVSAHGDYILSPIWNPAEDGAWAGKSFRVLVRFDGRAQAVQQGAWVVPVASRSARANPPLLQLAVRGYDGAVLSTFNDWHPLFRLVQAGDHDTLHTGGPAIGQFVFDYDPRASMLDIVDLASAQTVVVADLRQAEAQYCADNPTVDDCAADLALAKAAAVPVAYAGEPFVYALSVANLGPNPAHEVVITDHLPNALVVVGLAEGCTLEGAVVRCRSDVVPDGQSRAYDLTVTLAGDSVYARGGPFLVANAADVALTKGTDAAASNDHAAVVTPARAKSDLAVAAVEVKLLAPFVLVGHTAAAHFGLELTSAGPSSPMDASVVAAASGTGGLIATPASLRRIETLFAGAPSEVSGDMTASCAEPGTFTLAIDASIEPARADDIDPNPGNDQATVSMQVPCAIEVPVIVKPGATPPVLINLKAHGVVPVAVPTFTAGEYGLPIGFDATAILQGSGRLGTRESLASETGGAVAEHSHEPHIEDVLEPLPGGIATDGDLDAVMHFRVQSIGLCERDIEVCIRGLYSPSGSPSHSCVAPTLTFFGCAPVRLLHAPACATTQRGGGSPRRHDETPAGCFASSSGAAWPLLASMVALLSRRRHVP